MGRTRSIRSPLRHRAEFAAYRLAAAFARRVPLAGTQRAVAAVARAAFAGDRRHARHALVNLGLAFPERGEEELRALGKRSFEHFAWNLLDLLRSRSWTAEEVRARVAFEGRAQLDAALARGRGLILLGAHLGNFELGLLGASVRDVPLTVVSRPRRNGRIEADLTERRTRFGAEFVYHRNVVPAVLRALRRGRCVVVLNDQYAGRSRSVFAPLFGARCSTSAGVALLSLRTGCPVLPFHVVRDGPDHHTVRVAPPLEFERLGSRGTDVERATASTNEAIEALIRRHPDQWMWAHRRFRNSPDLPEGLYAAKSPRRPRRGRRARARGAARLLPGSGPARESAPEASEHPEIP